jgi:hypothetical protein
MNTAALASISSANVASTDDRCAGVARDHSGRALRAEATAMSTSAGVARDSCATAAPSAGLMTVCSGPAVCTGAPLIQLEATAADTAVMRATVAERHCPDQG